MLVVIALEIAGSVVLIAAGVLLADFVSGFVHWLEDSYGCETWPVIGPIVIEPNIRHHYSPRDFTEVSYWKRNLPIIVLAAISIGIFWIADLLNLFTISFVFAASQANETHRWAHLPSRRRPLFVRILQRAGLFVSSRHHGRHHIHPFNSHYCTITNYINPVIDGMKLFRGIEYAIFRVCRVKPRDDDVSAGRGSRRPPGKSAALTPFRG